MLNFLISTANSYTVSSTGYYYLTPANSGSQLIFDLESVSNYDYYLVWINNPSNIQIDGESLNTRVYKLKSTYGTYKVTSSSSSLYADFGVFLIPQTYDILEFWIKPASESYSMTQTTYSNTKNCYLIILDTESFTVYLENSGDSNDVYYSTDGGKPTSLFTSYALYSNKAVTLNYKQLASTTASTTYSISADDDNVHYNY